jgi:hypothetical protein
MTLVDRENLKLAAVATVCLGAGLTAPSAASVVQRVVNADKVDGLHAVKASTPEAKRKGVLVATSPKTGTLPRSVVGKAPDAARLGGSPLEQVRMQWVSFDEAGNVVQNSPGAAGITVTKPAAGTYCLPTGSILRGSVSGAIQSDLNGFEDIALVITSLYNTSACPGDIRIYTAKAGVLEDSPFTLTFQLAEPPS